MMHVFDCIETFLIVLIISRHCRFLSAVLNGIGTEFGHEPGITICLLESLPGSLSILHMHIFQIVQALKTKLFLEISKVTLGFDCFINAEPDSLKTTWEALSVAGGCGGPQT